ncbi:MAG: hypothetical protein JWO46_750 [Nocardioidaceae bacterium]|nr:hypothetical protein [Nocardioidaceae bacterium]
MSGLSIAPDLVLPIEAVTETFAILAKRGAGKSNAAVVMAEQMHAAGLPWVAIDPKGDWWGIRSSRDGKGAGLPVLVLGGRHGDVPLEPTAGALVANLIVEQRLTCVVDVSLMSKADMRRFLTAFAERLYQANTEPLHVFAEEAHEYIPQRVTGGDAPMVGAWEKLVKWGRTHGLGVTLITQRTASLNNDVLTQVETLIALRTTGPSDQKTIRAWVDEHETGAAMMAQLRKLGNGEAFVLSPQWLELAEPLRIQFDRRTTFDSGATPKAGQTQVTPRSFAEVDLAALKEAMAETIEKAKADDPKVLRAEIAQLRRDLAAADAAKPEAVIERVEIPVVTDEHLAQFALHAGTLTEDLSLIRARLEEINHQLPTEGNQGQPTTRRSAPRATSTSSTSGRAPDAGSSTHRRSTTPPSARETRPVADGGPSDGPIPKPMQRVLDAVAWLEAVGFSEPTKIQTGFIAGYRVGKKVGGTYGNLLGQLRTSGLIDYPTPGALRLTYEGFSMATPVDIEQSTRGLQSAIFARLADPEQRVLQAIVDAYPDAVSKQDVGEIAGYSVGAKVGGTFGNILGRLRSLGLVDYPSPGLVAATDVLFLQPGSQVSP